MEHSKRALHAFIDSISYKLALPLLYLGSSILYLYCELMINSTKQQKLKIPIWISALVLGVILLASNFIPGIPCILEIT